MIEISEYSEIIIWGASFPPSQTDGDATSHGRAIEKLQDILKEKGVWGNIVCIVDSNKSLWGKERLGVLIKNPLEILQHPTALVIINTISVVAVQKAIENLGIKNDYAIIPYYFYHGTVDHEYSNEVAKQDVIKNGSKIKDLYNEDDTRTRRYLDIILSMRLKGKDELYSKMDYEGTGESLAYFCDEELAPKGDVTYIDVGAYDGNSIAPVLHFYGNSLKRCIAFEPDEKSKRQLVNFLKKEKMSDITSVFPYALGNEDATIRFSSAGQMGQVSEDGDVVLEQRVFDNIPNIEVVGDAMVKMDIEGAEMGALRGMEHFIKKQQPYLAICLYHNEKDLFEIANYIKSLNPGYRLYLRGGVASRMLGSTGAAF